MNSPKSQPVLTLGREDWKKLRAALEEYNLQNGKWPKIRFSRERKEIIIRLGDRENSVTWIIASN